jgi:hypothetical protein
MEDEIVKILILKIITKKINSNQKNERPDLKY